MSTYRPTAIGSRTRGEVRFVPIVLQKSEFAIKGAKRLLQHNLPIAAIGRLIQSLRQRSVEDARHIEAECLGGLEVDH